MSPLQNEDQDTVLSRSSNKDSSCKVIKSLIEEISPIPEAGVSFAQRKRTKKGSQSVINSTPEIALLQQKDAEEKEKERKRSARKVKKIIDLQEYSEVDDLEDAEDENPACICCNSLYASLRPGDATLNVLV